MSNAHQARAVDGSRRRFVAATVAASTAVASTAPRVLARKPAANERINIGLIGLGTRGFGTHLPMMRKHAKAANVAVTALCDVWARPRQGAADRTKEWFGETPKQCSNYHDLLAMKDVDAVMIATPDFQHARMMKDVAEAGKDLYAEKPIAMDMAELNAAYDAIKKAGIVCSVGTQRRCDPHHLGCRDALRTGVLGHISRAEQRLNRNRPNWYIRLPRIPQMKQKDVDFDSFLMHRPKRKYDPLWVCGWYGYREFCSGSIGQFMSHFIDTVHMLTGATFPSSAVAQGGTYTWEDKKHGFDCPDHVQASLEYPERFLVHYSTNFGNASGRGTQLYGNQGVLNLDNERKPVITGDGAFDKRKAAKRQEIKPVGNGDIFLNWLHCLRSRKTPDASIDAGYQHAVACIMSDRAYETGQRQVFDKSKREVKAG